MRSAYHTTPSRTVDGAALGAAGGASPQGAIFLLLLITCVSCRHAAGPDSRDVPPTRGRADIHAERLEPRSPGGGDRLFVKLPPETTGMDFVHDWVSPEDYPHDLETMMAGGGVAIGDYDADGLPDVYLARPRGGNRLYRNLGRLQFADVTDAAGLGQQAFWGGGVSFVDIDNDGDLDLYACGHSCPNRLYVNQGDGTFDEQAQRLGLAFQGASVMMSFADYDRDGDLDGYLLTNHLPPPSDLSEVKAAKVNGRWVVPDQVREYRDVLTHPDGSPVPVRAAQFDHLFRNEGRDSRGQIRFVDVSQAAGITGNHHGLSATWWDYNQDGLPDLYVANDFTDPDRLYRNNGDGTFTDCLAEVVPHTPWFSMGTDVADVNNDGRLDLLATDMAGTSHYKQKVGMGDMSSRLWFLDYPTPRQYMRNALYLNSGTGRCMEAAYLAGLANTDWTWAVCFGDLDNDGRVDLYVTNGMTRDWQNSDLKHHVQTLGGKDTPAGRKFWIAQPPKAEANLAFRNRGDLRFEPVGQRWGLDDVGVSFGASLADLDRDGDLDLVVNSFQQPAAVYRNDEARGNRLLVRLHGTSSNSHGVGARVTLHSSSGTQTQTVTLARGFMSSANPELHFGLGTAATADELQIEWPSGARQQFYGLAANHVYTITESDHSASTIPTRRQTQPWFRDSKALLAVKHQETPFDDFSQQPLLPNRLSQLGPGIACGDLDGDGDDDFYVGGAAGRAGMLVLNLDGQFAVSPQSTTPSGTFYLDRDHEDMGALFLDVDADRDLDLFCVSGGVEHGPGHALLVDRLYLNDGRGRFRRAAPGVVPEYRDSGSAVVAADYDRDGDLDLFVGGRVVPGQYPLPAQSHLLRNDSSGQQAHFTDMTDELAAGLRTTGLVTGALWSDADQDGWVDLLVATEWGPIKLFRNQQARLVDATGQADLADRMGWWTGISAADVDHDRDMDYVVTNFGLNTKYHASADRPQVLYYGDFDGSGQSRIVEAEYEGDVLYPVRGRSCSSHAIPTLGQRFTSFHDFAVASLSEIYTEQCLQHARRFVANTLESGILINDGHARFTFHAFPRLAQIAPSFGSVMTDVNRDGHADVLLVQNFFAPQAETGRMDGGLSWLLLGDGTGRFEPVWPDQSGLVVPDDAKSLVLADTNQDGVDDFVVGVNNGATRVFERYRSEQPGVRLELRGRAGNSLAAGARVEIQLANQETHVFEIHCGHGYLSQSAGRIELATKGVALEKVVVHWPDGHRSTHAPVAGPGLWTIEQP